jgi:UDP-glucose 4-epimerase
VVSKILVAGGAGYVGAHTCMKLAEAGFVPVVVDNLSNGHRDFVQWGPFEEADIRDEQALAEIFDRHRIVAIVHLAGLIEVGESIKDPLSFYDNNVTGSVTLFVAALKASVRRIVFSSTCATYGSPIQMPIREDHPQHPINPYGRTKLVVEQALADLDSYAGVRSVVLRYFNAAGADPEGRIGERHQPETHAIPLALQTALGLRGPFSIFGEDYDTPDGTAIRDYVHVSDLADAHVLALQHLLNGGQSEALNLGTGVGISVRQLVEAIEFETGERLEINVSARRNGDAPMLVADNERAHEVLGWRPQLEFTEIISSALAWHKAEARRTEFSASRMNDFKGEPIENNARR